MTAYGHPLDRPAWHALTTRQASLAIGAAQAVRFRPEVNMFGAAADSAPASLAALVSLLPAGGTLGLIELGPPPSLPGTTRVAARAIDQMVLTTLKRRAPRVEIVSLDMSDVAEMLALTALTEPGPFYAETVLQGGFIGVKQGGRLIAMAGERMQPPGFAEVSSVCTHPDARGRGLARALMEAVIDGILARGEQAFLQTYPDNPAVRLYAALGFRSRRTMTYSVVSRALIDATAP